MWKHPRAPSSRKDCSMQTAETFSIHDDATWMAGFRARAATRRVPLSAQLELTSRCNLRCQHCYLGNQLEQHRKRSEERDTQAVLSSLDSWAAAGVFHLVITGGDPMVRRDFAEIYRHAAELGMLVTVFCDGILVSDTILALFHTYPPRGIEISIYGATAETYETVTRVPGSHAMAWKGIHRLLDAGIRVILKTVLMTLNEHELGDMAQQAEALGCEFKFDAAIFPCLPDHSKEPLDLRVSPETAVKWDMAFPERRRKWEAAVARPTPEAKVGDRIYTCGAGTTAFYCDPFGNLSPCLMTTHYRYAAEGRDFQEVWQHELGEIRSRKRTRSGGCLSGPLRNACTHCPAFNHLETGDEETDSAYMKRTAELRYAALRSQQQEG